MPPTWYNDDWGYCFSVTVPSSSLTGDVTGFEVYLRLSDAPAGLFTHANSDGGDIRITESDGVTEVAREIVSFTTSSSDGEVHFVSDLSSSSDNVFYVYYGNPSASDYAKDATYGAYNVWNAKYDVVYHLNDLTYTNSAQSSYQLTQVGSATNTTGLVGEDALASSGTGNYAYVEPSPWNTALTSFTVSMWIQTNTTSITAGTVFVGTRDTSATSGEFVFGGKSNGTGVTFWNYNSGYGFSNTQGSTANIADENPHLICFSYIDGTQGIYYIDGAADAEPTGSKTVTYVNTMHLCLGGSIRTGDLTFQGTMDEVRIGSFAMDQYTAAAEYANQNDPATFYTVGSENTKPSTAASLTNISSIGNITSITI